MHVGEVLLTALKPKDFTQAAKAWRLEIQRREADLEAREKLLVDNLKDAERELRTYKFMEKHRSLDGLRGLYQGINRDMVALAEKHQVKIPALVEVDSLGAARGAANALQKAASAVRTGSSFNKNLGPLGKKIGDLEALAQSWTDALAARDAANKALLRLSADGLDSKTLAKKKLDLGSREVDELERLQGLNALRSLLTQASQYFDANNPPDCPVCEQPLPQPGVVKSRLASRIETLSSKAVRDAERAVSQVRQQIKALAKPEERANQADAELRDASRHLETQRKRIMTALNRPALLEKKVADEIAAALRPLESERRKLQEGLTEVEKDLEALLTRDREISNGLVPFLKAREDLRKLEAEKKRAKAGAAKLISKAEDMEGLATTIEAIRSAVLAAKQEVAGNALDRASDRAQKLYVELVQHPLFDTLSVKANLKAAKVDYAFEVSSSHHKRSARDARVILSDGQLTAAALGLFYALAESTVHGLDFIYIDDPTQNLDHPHKEAMAKAIADIATRKQVVLATQDDDFVSLLRDYGFVDSGVLHEIKAWNGSPDVLTTVGEN